MEATYQKDLEALAKDNPKVAELFNKIQAYHLNIAMILERIRRKRRN